MWVACGVQRTAFLEQAEQVQTDMGKSLKEVQHRILRSMFVFRVDSHSAG
eukprot:COSAG02_NODE_15745_length_1144_cov_1.305263_3_plen_49_part_01